MVGNALSANAVIMKNASLRKQNLLVAYVDYTKTFDFCGMPLGFVRNSTTKLNRKLEKRQVDNSPNKFL